MFYKFSRYMHPLFAFLKDGEPSLTRTNINIKHYACILYLWVKPVHRGGSTINAGTGRSHVLEIGSLWAQLNDTFTTGDHCPRSKHEDLTVANAAAAKGPLLISQSPCPPPPTDSINTHLSNNFIIAFILVYIYIYICSSITYDINT